MKKQIASLILIASAMTASSAHADNLTALLTVLQNGSMQQTGISDNITAKNVGIERCTDQQLTTGACVIPLMANMGYHMDVKLGDNKKVVFTASDDCGRDVVVRDPNNYELDLRGSTEFNMSGPYDVVNRGFNTCEVQVMVVKNQSANVHMRPMAGVADNLTSLLTVLNAFRR